MHLTFDQAAFEILVLAHVALRQLPFTGQVAKIAGIVVGVLALIMAAVVAYHQVTVSA